MEYVAVFVAGASAAAIKLDDVLGAGGEIAKQELHRKLGLLGTLARIALQGPRPCGRARDADEGDCRNQRAKLDEPHVVLFPVQPGRRATPLAP